MTALYRRPDHMSKKKNTQGDDPLFHVHDNNAWESRGMIPAPQEQQEQQQKQQKQQQQQPEQEEGVGGKGERNLKYNPTAGHGQGGGADASGASEQLGQWARKILGSA